MKEKLLEDEASSERKPFAFPRNIFDGGKLPYHAT